ncbi:MAG: hypothetical protein M3680_35985, partial [Myxococcota bacterium]|nr:hypothetical protein [Myxococcota bacterium]
DGLGRKRRDRRLLGLSLVGGGVAFGVAGGVFGVCASSRFDEAKRACGGDIAACDPMQVAASQELVDRARSAGTISTALVIAAGALATAGIVVYVTAPSAEQPRVSLTPVIGDGAAGFVLSGGF